jgi:hypothetical protein
MTSPTIIMVNDRGLKDTKGSYGVVVGTSDKKISATLEGIVKGNPLHMTSHRYEEYGRDA